MRAARALGALAAGCTFALAVPAHAADPSPAPIAASAALSAKVDTAIASATSYRIAVQGPNGLSLDIREFGPDRVRIASTTPAGASESIVVGSAMYYRAGGGTWKAYPVAPIKRVRLNRLYMGAPDTLLEPLPDRTDADGSAVGAFRASALGNGQKPGTMECTYDKSTYRPRSCSVTLQGLSPSILVTYAGWDDPSNAVEPPEGVAPPGSLPAAAPSASPKVPG